MHDTPNKSKVLESIIGKICTLTLDSSLTNFEVKILDVDDNWLKFCRLDKKNGDGVQIVKLNRVYELTGIRKA